MIPSAGRRVAVCSWSLRPSSAAELARRVRDCGLSAVQLALDPIRDGRWNEDQTIAVLADAGIAVVSGMMAFEGEDYSTLDSIRATGGVRLDANWERNLEAARANADLAARLGVGLVTFHAGFLPHDPADPVRRVMLDRLRRIIGAFAGRAVSTAFETGQESADTLLGVLDELPGDGVGVNFDPANMILYGMGDPVRAADLLADRITQVHIKDARAAAAPGQWGTETPAGQGGVRWPEFFATLRRRAVRCAFAIEREAGHTREHDIRAAAALVAQHHRDEGAAA